MVTPHRIKHTTLARRLLTLPKDWYNKMRKPILFA